MKLFTKALIIITILFITSGCGRIIYSTMPEFNCYGPYRGIKVDYLIITNGDFSEGSFLLVLDLPFSFILDTIFLPLDLYKISKKEPERKDKEN